MSQSLSGRSERFRQDLVYANTQQILAGPPAEELEIAETLPQQHLFSAFFSAYARSFLEFWRKIFGRMLPGPFFVEEQHLRLRYLFLPAWINPIPLAE